MTFPWFPLSIALSGGLLGMLESLIDDVLPGASVYKLPAIYSFILLAIALIKQLILN